MIRQDIVIIGAWPRAADAIDEARQIATDNVRVVGVSNAAKLSRPSVALFFNVAEGHKCPCCQRVIEKLFGE